MGKRTYLADITAMALLYRKTYVGSTMISYDKIKYFDRVINENLDQMNSSCGIGIRNSLDDNSDLFFFATAEDGNVYAVIDPRADLQEAWSYHIGCLPTDVVIASQQNNALQTIGLRLENGQMYSLAPKESKPNKLILKNNNRK